MLKFVSLQRKAPYFGLLLVTGLALTGCEDTTSNNDEAALSTVTAFVVPGSYEAQGILWVANEHDPHT